MTIATAVIAAAYYVTFTWTGVPNVAAYRVDCGQQPGKYNLRQYWTQDYGPPRATQIRVRSQINKTAYCAVRSYRNGIFSNYSNQVVLTPLPRVERDVDDPLDEEIEIEQ